MSRPYQHPSDAQRSSFDRRPQGSSSQPNPTSFNTNVNRAKTKKWVEAKTFSYDGDDWGDYDEIDEYGASAPPPVPQQSALPGHMQNVGAGRSFTDPRSGPAPSLGRKNSFETGDERRAFSGSHDPRQAPRVGTQGQRYPQNEDFTQSPASITPSAAPFNKHPYGSGPGQVHQQVPASRQSSAASWNQSVISDTPSANMEPQHRGDFNPSALPQPLHTQSRERVPSGSNNSPAIIRPADIYKRMAEAKEKERASLDSTRATASSQDGRKDVQAPRKPLEENKPDSISGRQPATYAEGAKGGNGSVPGQRISVSPELPQFSPTTNFGDDFWSLSGFGSQQGSQPVKATQSTRPDPAESSLRGVVDQAFTRRDDNSVPPTPISRVMDAQSDETGSGVSRSNTDSTSGISPIMSRVPSSAAAAARAKVAEEKDMATPVIVEESPNASRRASHTPYGLQQAPRRPDAATHSRTGSGSSITKRKSLNSPSPNDSPARSPIVAATTKFPEPSAVEFDAASPTSASTGRSPISPSANYAVREADLAKAASNGSDKDLTELAQKEKDSQTAFLQQTREFDGPPSSTAATLDRADSPSKGRVRDLAERFGEVSDSRRNSIQSISSRKSEQASDRPVPTREESFRPKLPGQWESFVTTPGISTSTAESSQQLGNKPGSESDEEVDLEPTTPKRSATLNVAKVTANEAMAALAAAGSAMGDSIKAATGMGGSDAADTSKRSVGDIYSRPSGPTREESAMTATSYAPSLPPKDDSLSASETESDEIVPPAPLKGRSREGTPQAAMKVSSLGVDISSGDTDNERLREDIVKTLSPIGDESPEAAKVTEKLAAPAATSHGDSSGLPAHQDTLWPGGGATDTYPFRDLGAAPEQPVTRTDSSDAAVQGRTDQAEFTGPGYINRRYSWEKPVDNSASAHPSTKVIDDSNVANVTTNSDHTGQNDLSPPSVQSTSRTGAGLPDSPVSNLGTLDSSPSQGLHVVNSDRSELAERPSFGMQNIDLATPQPTEPVPIEAGTGSPAVTTPVVDKGKIPPFREILALKSAKERTETYDRTRQQFAEMDTGLRNWIAVTLVQRPQHAELREIATRPPPAAVAVPNTNRHRHTPSLSVFSKMNPTGNTPSSPVVAQTSSPMASSTEKPPGSSGGAKVQARGKEFLHSAGIFSGKATTGAKGLFAKGKSRFKGGSGDKAE